MSPPLTTSKTRTAQPRNQAASVEYPYVAVSNLEGFPTFLSSESFSNRAKPDVFI